MDLVTTCNKHQTINKQANGKAIEREWEGESGPSFLFVFLFFSFYTLRYVFVFFTSSSQTITFRIAITPLHSCSVFITLHSRALLDPSSRNQFQGHTPLSHCNATTNNNTQNKKKKQQTRQAQLQKHILIHLYPPPPLHSYLSPVLPKTNKRPSPLTQSNQTSTTLKQALQSQIAPTKEQNTTRYLRDQFKAPNSHIAHLTAGIRTNRPITQSSPTLEPTRIKKKNTLALPLSLAYFHYPSASFSKIASAFSNQQILSPCPTTLSTNWIPTPLLTTSLTAPFASGGVTSSASSGPASPCLLHRHYFPGSKTSST